MASPGDLQISFLSSDTFRDIFQTSAEGILMVNDSGKILLANPVSEKMFGYPSGCLVGNQIESLIPASARGRHTKHRKEFNSDPEPRRMGVGRDLMAMRQDGSEFPVEVSLSYTRANNQLLIMAFVSDISRRKEAEEALRKSEEQLMRYATELEKKVHARTETLNSVVKELEKANDELQEQILERQKAEEEVRKSLEKERQLNDLKSKFVSIASHEFRTPLSTVLSSASLVKQYKDRGDFEKVDKHITRIKSSVNHLTDILNEFLSLGRLEEGRVDVQLEQVDLTELLEGVQEELEPTLKPNQKILLKIGSGGLVHSDPRILRNILFNLISNASKYSDPGKRIWIEADLKPKQLTLAIKDEGMGIPQAEIEHIFQRFFRATNASNHQGTGLGLSIVKRYASLLNGDVTFTSKEGEGSIFTVTIPYEQDSAD